MAFVYRYRNRLGQSKYVGLVKGHKLVNLLSRHNDHLHEDRPFPSWSFEYIGGLTKAEADALETHFINLEPDHLINVAKKGWGIIRWFLGQNFDWQPLDPLCDINSIINTPVNKQLTKLVSLGESVLQISEHMPLTYLDADENLEDYGWYLTENEAGELTYACIHCNSPAPIINGYPKITPYCPWCGFSAWDEFHPIESDDETIRDFGRFSMDAMLIYEDIANAIEDIEEEEDNGED